MAYLQLSWDEFVAAAMIHLQQTHPTLHSPEFKQRNGYEPDSDCYNFPPAYVIIDIIPKKEKVNASSV